MEEKGLSVQFQMQDQKLWVDGDAERLVWALNNLLRNARDYTPAGGNVHIEIFSENNKARVDIMDTGIGISATDQPYLFTRFFRAQNEHTFNVPGMGLGLFIVRSIVEAHGGAVWARSEVGVGSLFSLALPLIEEEKEEVTRRQTATSIS
jgi:signal transduction histidine kinase